MIPMEYLSVDAKYPARLNPSSKSGQSTNRNRFIKHNSLKLKRKIGSGPAVVLRIGEPTQEYTLGYDRFGKLKKI